MLLLLVALFFSGDHRTIKGELEPQTHRFGTSAQGRTAYLPVRPSAVQAVITRENGITENFRGRTIVPWDNNILILLSHGQYIIILSMEYINWKIY